MTENKVTAVIPTFNRSKFLKRAVASVQNQTHKDVLVSIMDNASTDDTREIVREISTADPRITYRANQKNVGAVENIRLGITTVSSSFFSFLCDDDHLEPNFYADGITLLEKYPNASFAVFRVEIVDEGGKTIKSNLEFFKAIKDEKYYLSEAGLKSLLNAKIPVGITGILFRSEVAKTIDFGEFAEVGYGADISFVLHAAARYNFVVTSRKGGNFTVHRNQMSELSVGVFDERFLYWWRNRLQRVIDDPTISDENRSTLEEYYFTHSTKSWSSKKYYLYHAINIINERLKNKDHKRLKVELLAMKSFLSAMTLSLIVLSLASIISLGLDDRARNMVRTINRIAKKHTD
jgi:glycosyltransferase involved in cell wall biosynthesis